MSRRSRLKALRAAADGAASAGVTEDGPSNNAVAANTPTPLATPLLGPEDGQPPAGGGGIGPTYGFYTDPMSQYEDPKVAGRVIAGMSHHAGMSGPGPSRGLVPSMGPGAVPPPRQLKAAPPTTYPPVYAGGRPSSSSAVTGPAPPPPPGRSFAVPAGGARMPLPPPSFGPAPNQFQFAPPPGGVHPGLGIGGLGRGGGDVGGGWDGGGGRGRGGHRGPKAPRLDHRGGSGSGGSRGDMGAYYKKSMVEDPWRHLTR